ncbi:MAG: hypothetical protein ACI9MC_004265, partial [Kiritimatiellia bacterium]
MSTRHQPRDGQPARPWGLLPKRFWLPLFLTACQPLTEPSATGCVQRPASGVVVREITCETDRWSGADARLGDWMIANAHVRLVIRNGQGALSKPGIGGATLIDASPWGQYDRLNEAIPLIDGGWMRVSSVEPLTDGLRVTGRSTSIPGLPPAIQDLDVQITYRLSPDAPALTIEGATGLLVRPRAGGTLVGERLEMDGVTFASSSWSDLGGALRIDGEPVVLVAPTEQIFRWLEPSADLINIELLDADAVQLLSGEEVISTVPARGDHLQIYVPNKVDGVRALGAGHAPSPVLAPLAQMSMQTGPSGNIFVRPTWERTPHTFQVSWTDAATSHTITLGPGGGEVATGAGPIRLRLPGVDPLDVDVPVGEETVITTDMDGHAAGRSKLWLSWPSSRAATWRGSESTALQLAAGQGLRFVVRTGDNQPARQVSADDAIIPSRSGVSLTLDSGSTVISWPWSDNGRLPGRGIPDVRNLPVSDVLAVLKADQRLTVIDMPTLSALGVAWTAQPHPAMVMLESPGPTGPTSGAWDPWFTWLDAGVHLPPAGPSLSVQLPEYASAIDYE